MLTFEDIIKLKTLFQNNENIIKYIKNNTQLNPEEAILHSYDLQAGSYIQELIDKEQKTHKIEVGLKLAKIFSELAVQCVCEVGVGEATTLGHVLPFLEINKKFGFDISMSRLLYAKKYLEQNQLTADLFCAELSRIPFFNDSIECVYSFHSLEPNGGNEKFLLSELLRVTKKYLILIEPDYDLFSAEQKDRMNQHGYIKHLRHHLSELGAHVIHYEPWELDSYHLNSASIIIVEKSNAVSDFFREDYFCSPISHQPVVNVLDGWFCEEDGYLFPSINNIPVFLRKNAILISHYNNISLK